jgi:hypothetical protein
MTSNNEFALNYRKKLLDVHWRQWRALGVTYRAPAETYWILDLEALYVSSLTMCIHDHQLLTACIEWLARNREWINLSRLKCIVKKFANSISDSFGALLPATVIKLLENTLQQYGFNLTLGGMKSNKKHANIDAADYEEVFKKFQMEDIVPKIAYIRSPVLLQLSLRASYGNHARTETFLYLLLKKQGDLPSIAREICYSEKTVHKVLERWVTSGFVKQIHDEYLVTTPSWHDFWTYGENQGYLNWARTLHVLDQIQFLLSTDPWCNDPDALALAFRVLAKEVDQIAAACNVRMPDVKIHPAEEYYSLFTCGLIELLDHLLNPTT